MKNNLCTVKVIRVASTANIALRYYLKTLGGLYLCSHALKPALYFPEGHLKNIAQQVCIEFSRASEL